LGKTQKIIRPSSRIQISSPGMRTYTEATGKYPPVAYQFFSQKYCRMNHVINFATDKRFGFVDTSHSRLEEKETARRVARS